MNELKSSKERSIPGAGAEQLAELFHATYERLAPEFGYTTRTDTRRFDRGSHNGKLMIAVCEEILTWFDRQDDEIRHLRTAIEQLREALRKAADTFADVARASRMLRHDVMASACMVAEEATRNMLAGVETPAPQAPIANLIIDENGECSAACMYAPGLPPGAHDVYCETTARQVPRKGWMIEKVGSSPPQWWKGTECNLQLDEAWTTDPNNTAIFASDTSALVVQMALARNTWRYPERAKAVGKLTVSEHEWPAVETAGEHPCE